jgi:hypothetical protein
VSQGSVVGITTGYGLDDQGVGVRVSVGSRLLTYPYYPDRLWDPPNLLSNEYLEFWGSSSDERKEKPTLLGPLERANHNHWAIQGKVKVKVTLRPQSVGVGLGVRRQSGTSDQFSFLLEIFF